MPLSGERGKLYENYYTHNQSPSVEISSEDTFRGSARRRLLFAWGYKNFAKNSREAKLGKILDMYPPLHEATGSDVMFLRGESKGRLLDIGCGDGSFMHRMDSLGWSVLGLEVDHAAAEIARKRYGLPVVLGPTEETALPQETFDAICMNHVLEHVENPTGLLKTCGHLLKRQGVLAVKTPNVESLGHRVFGRDWVSLDPPRHLHLFSRGTLRRCVEEAGLAMMWLKTSAHGAPIVYDLSRRIRSEGKAAYSREPSRVSVRARAFRLLEGVAGAVDIDAGEEIVLLAARP